jgi:hypothetical protein
MCRILCKLDFGISNIRDGLGYYCASWILECIAGFSFEEFLTEKSIVGSRFGCL